MKLRKLQLTNFRNYNSYTYEFSPQQNCTILVGENGQGKTNFLEAIYLLSLGRSFRSTKQENLIEWEKDYLRCQAEITHDDESTELEVFCSTQPRKQKNFKKNGVSLRNSNYIGSLLTVLFHPEDLNLLYLSPALRRKYLNTILSQTDKHYLHALSRYNKILRQRNALLKILRENRNHDLETWNQQLIEVGSEIISKRLAYTVFLQDHIQNIYQSISEASEKVTVTYQSKFDISTEISKNFLSELNYRRERDIRQGQTTCGPHRDDLTFFINNKEITESASRGEFRTLLLAIKLAEIKYIKQQTGKSPILLLDDVFSELDLKRQAHLLEIISTCQTIITTTDLSGLEKLAHRSTVVDVNRAK